MITLVQRSRPIRDKLHKDNIQDSILRAIDTILKYLITRTSTRQSEVIRETTQYLEQCTNHYIVHTSRITLSTRID